MLIKKFKIGKANFQYQVGSYTGNPIWKEVHRESIHKTGNFLQKQKQLKKAKMWSEMVNLENTGKNPHMLILF